MQLRMMRRSDICELAEVSENLSADEGVDDAGANEAMGYVRSRKDYSFT